MKTDKNVQGLGTDIIEIERVRQSIDRHGQHFLNRLFTQQEQDYCYQFKDPVPHFAGRFAAKEAIAKALGTGFGAHLAWHDIEVLNDSKGKPTVRIIEKSEFKDAQILVSISHSKDYATAVAMWV